MNIRSAARCYLWSDLNGLFPKATSPAYMTTDFPWQVSPVNWADNGGFIAFPEGEFMMPAPLRVPHNQQKPASQQGTQIPSQSGQTLIDAYPYVEWEQLNGSAPVSYRVNHPDGFIECAAEQWDGSGAGALDCQVTQQMQGATLFWQRTDYANADNVGGSDATDDGRSFEIIAQVGIDKDAIYYSIVYHGNGEILARYYFPDTETYKPIAALEAPGDVVKTGWGEFSTDNEPTAVEFTLIGGRLYINSGSQDQPFAVDEYRVDSSGNPILWIEKVRVRSNWHRTLYFSLHPTKFYASVSMESQSIPIGFQSMNDPEWYVSLGAAGMEYGSVNVDISSTQTDSGQSSLRGPNVQYLLSMQTEFEGTYKGCPYASFAPPIHSVTLKWHRGPVNYGSAEWTEIKPQAVQVTQRFDMDSLTIQSGATFMFHDNRAFWASWGAQTGQVGVAVEFQRTLQNGHASAPYRVFTGIGNTRNQSQGGSGSSTFTMSAEDPMRQLREPRFSEPWMDGWNSVFMVAFLSQQGGIPLEQMAFIGNVPDDPFTDLGDSSNANAYFLPVGPASTNLTRFRSAKILDVIMKVAYSIGYMIYFDVFGKLHFEKFSLPFIDETGWYNSYNIKREFYESDWESEVYGNGGAEGAWSFTSTKSMDNVRNKVVIVGVDVLSPSWEPVVAVTTDRNSVFSPWSANFLSYLAPFVWEDSQFSSAQYAWAVASHILQFMRLPERRLTFETWLQPDIYPLDLITLRSPRAGTRGIVFMVTAVSHSQSTPDLRGKTTIEAYGISVLPPISLEPDNLGS